MFRSVVAALAACLLIACGDANPPRGSMRGMAALQQAESCQALESELKAQAIVDMNRHLDEELKQVLDGQCFYGCGDYAAMGAPSAGTSNTQPSSGARQYSTTNNQVAGVDESDFLKNDGKYLYVLANGHLQIIDAFPPEQAHLLSRTAIEGEPKRLFVHEGKAIVYSSLAQEPTSRYGREECTYGYDCEFTGDRAPLKVTVLDLADLAAPKMLRELSFSGSHLASRRIGNSVHTVVNFPDPVIPGLELDVPGDSCTVRTSLETELLVAKVEQQRQANLQRIAQAPLAAFLPSVTDTRHTPSGVVAASNLLSDCGSYFISRQADGRAVLALISFEASGSGPIGSTAIVGRPGAVYASGDSLYVASRHAYQSGQGWFFDGPSRSDEATTVHKFSLSAEPPSARYSGSGVVKGHVLNQFAMDEHQGFLRIATSNGRVPDPKVSSAVTVLGQGPSGLVEVGKVDGIAPGEDLRSVRFDGDQGFIVTFKKTDPLFALDLSVPSQPRSAGELKIPGFSTYLHKMDDTHLLSVGFDADDQGSFAYFQGLQLQIFDISDLANPTLAHKAVIGTRGSTSEAATNHLAFNYFAPKGLLALPMVVCDGTPGGPSFGTMSFGGLMVFEADPNTGFRLRGGVAHEAPETATSNQNACSRWWSDASTHVKRSVIMDDYVYSVAQDLIRVHRLEALGTDVAVIPL